MTSSELIQVQNSKVSISIYIAKKSYLSLFFQMENLTNMRGFSNISDRSTSISIIFVGLFLHQNIYNDINSVYDGDELWGTIFPLSDSCHSIVNIRTNVHQDGQQTQPHARLRHGESLKTRVRGLSGGVDM